MSRKIPKNLKPGERFGVERGLFVRMTRGGIKWGISYYDADGNHHREIVGDNKTIARAALASRKADIARGIFKLEPRRRPPSFAALADTYLDHCKQHKRSWKRDELALDVAKEFLKKRADNVTTWDIERFKAWRRESVSPSTVNRDLATLSHLFNLAIDWGHVKTNPVSRVKRYRLDERPMRVLTEKEETKLLAAASGHLRPILNVAIYSGLRRGEILRLDWRDVDWSRGVITVVQSKSGKVREVPLHPRVRAALKPRKRSGRIFPYSDIKKSFAGAVSRAKIQPLRFHDLRVTFLTRLAWSGADVKTVQEIAGHASVQTTLKYYLGSSRDRKRDAVERI